MNDIVREVGGKLIMLIAIIAGGISFMYFSDDAATAICVGIGYLIAIAGTILVLIGYDYDLILKASILRRNQKDRRG